MIIDIKSKNNETLKYTKSLLKNKVRMNDKKYIVDGYRIVKHALESKENIEYVIFCDEFCKKDEHKDFVSCLEKEGIKLYKCDYKSMKEICETENPQGIIAVLNMNDKEVKIADKNFVIILDRIQDPGNMGTIIRTADAAGVDCIISLKGSVDIYNQKVIRSTMGSIFNIPVLQGIDMSFIDKIKDNDFMIVSSCLKTDKYYDSVNYKGKIALVIGNEAGGICDEILQNSDELIKIPIYGKSESLNASIASAILMYEIKKNLK